MRIFSIEDFSGGWNPRDAWSQVADNESPDMYNVTLDERGGVAKRLGLTKVNSSQASSSYNFAQLYYSAELQLLIGRLNDTLYKSTDGVSWESFKTFTTATQVGLVDFNNKLVMIHPVDTAFSYDGATVSGAITNAPKGTMLAVWQNAIWSAGDPADPSRVTRSDLGAITWPASPVSNAVRDKDDKAITALGGGQGMDVVGRSGMFVFKEDSTYRMHDATNGAYTTIDYQYGASGAGAIATNMGITCAISTKGVLALGEEEGGIVSQKLEPLFRPSQLTLANASNWCAAPYRDRILFSMGRSTGSVNNLTLEYSPMGGWFAPHGFGLSCMTSYEKATRKVYGGRLGTAAASYGFVYNVFSGGSDDGSAIAARWQSRWFEPHSSSDSRFRRIVTNGRGEFNLYFKRNYEVTEGLVYPIDISGGTTTLWGTAVWGKDIWSSKTFQGYDIVFSPGHGRSFSLQVQESSTTSTTGPNLLADGTAEAVGAFAVYGFAIDYERLGFS